MCQHLEAEFSRIKFLEVEQIQTANHDIAYYIKRKYPDDSPFEEGDVVGFFESVHGETVIDLLTSENAHDARLAGVISRTAYLVGNTGRNDKERNGRLRLGGDIYPFKCRWFLLLRNLKKLKKI